MAVSSKLPVVPVPDSLCPASAGYPDAGAQGSISPTQDRSSLISDKLGPPPFFFVFTQNGRHSGGSLHCLVPDSYYTMRMEGFPVAVLLNRFSQWLNMHGAAQCHPRSWGAVTELKSHGAERPYVRRTTCIAKAFMELGFPAETHRLYWTKRIGRCHR